MTRRPGGRSGTIRVGYLGEPRAVRFLGRPNRYLAHVRPLEGGAPFDAHVPNPGRMGELLVPGATLGYVVPAYRPGRKTAFDLVAVRHGAELVSVDSRMANRIVGRVLAAGGLRAFGDGPWRAEPTWGRSRLDFGMGSARAGYTALLEVKSSNLRLGSDAAFPDAPTVRGTRHVEELTRAARRGIRAGILFVVQRAHARRFRPNAELDPAFARALARASRAGVTIAAHTLEVAPGSVRWGRPVPVELVDNRGPPPHSI